MTCKVSGESVLCNFTLTLTVSSANFLITALSWSIIVLWERWERITLILFTRAEPVGSTLAVVIYVLWVQRRVCRRTMSVHVLRVREIYSIYSSTSVIQSFNENIRVKSKQYYSCVFISETKLCVKKKKYSPRISSFKPIVIL